MMRPGPRNLITDVAGLRVGNAEDAALNSGVTVLTADAPFVASVFVMGGAPGTRETDLLHPSMSVQAVDALVLSGGSAFGLDAAAGVMEGLRAAGRGYAVGAARVPIVPAAILFDLLNGGDKAWTLNPYPALGLAAWSEAAEDFALGSAGAGKGALTAMLKGGLGSASFILPDGTCVGAMAAVNAAGSATTPGEQYFWAAPFEYGDEFGGLGADPRGGLGASTESRKRSAMQTGANTTIAIVATDAALDKAALHRMAQAAHAGLARALVPSHTPMDGDLVFAVSTGAKESGAPALIGHAAALCLSRAIARGVHAAVPSSGDLLPAWQDVN
jgi:D-aminopeptidase